MDHERVSDSRYRFSSEGMIFICELTECMSQRLIEAKINLKVEPTYSFELCFYISFNLLLNHFDMVKVADERIGLKLSYRRKNTSKHHKFNEICK